MVVVERVGRMLFLLEARIRGCGFVAMGVLGDDGRVRVVDVGRQQHLARRAADKRNMRMKRRRANLPRPALLR